MAGDYVLGQGVALSLGQHLRGLGERCLLLCDRHPSDELLSRMGQGILAGSGIASVEVRRIVRPACEKGPARALAEDVRSFGADVVVAFGSSKILDLARAALRCLQPDRPALALVTSVVASNASVGSLAVMYGEDGLPNGFWKLDQPPELVAVDPTFVVEASPRLLSAAMGDQLASSLEATDAVRLQGTWGQGHDDHMGAIDAIFRHGAAALGEVGRHEMGPALMEVLRAVTHYTPSQELAAGARMCHVLGAALSADPRTAGRTHGEVVAACIPAELVLTGDGGDLGRWAVLLRELGLPVGLAGLGIASADVAGVERLISVAASCPIGEDSVIARDPEAAVRAVLEAEGRLVQLAP